MPTCALYAPPVLPRVLENQSSFSEVDPDDGTLGVFITSRARIAAGIPQYPRIGALVPNVAEPLRWNLVFRRSSSQVRS